MSLKIGLVDGDVMHACAVMTRNLGVLTRKITCDKVGTPENIQEYQYVQYIQERSKYLAVYGYVCTCRTHKIKINLQLRLLLGVNQRIIN